MIILEKLIRSKAGANLDDCEDGVVVTKDYCCVIDGATSATGSKWTAKQWTGGQWASNVLQDGVHRLPFDAKPREIVDSLSECILNAYKSEQGVFEIMQARKLERATASIVIYSKCLKQIIIVGDCQAALINRRGKIFEVIQPGKYNDDVMSQARCMFLHLQLMQEGLTREELRMGVDAGRAFIEPLRTGQRLFQNNPSAPKPYQYWVLDGFPVADDGIQVYAVPRRACEVILASDGYVSLCPTLEETEAKLKALLRNDPMMMELELSTKGVRPGAESFDDRSFLHFEICQSEYNNSVSLAITMLVAVWSLYWFQKT